MTRMLVNGIHLNVEVTGAGPAVLLLHGFTGDTTTWEPFLPTINGFQAIRVDLIGHGGSDAPEDPERYSLTHAATDLIAVLDQLGVASAALVGYSLGGRVALHLALAAPQRFWALILESASPGIESEDERAARIVSDSALANGLLRDGLEAFVDRWQAQALFASQLKLPAEVQERQRRQRLGQKSLGLANSLRGMGAGRQEYLLPRLSQLSMPALLIAGALDTKYTDLTHQMAQVMPEVTLDIVEDAGHAVHLEKPERFARLLGTFLIMLLGDDMDRLHREQNHAGPIPSPVSQSPSLEDRT